MSPVDLDESCGSHKPQHSEERPVDNRRGRSNVNLHLIGALLVAVALQAALWSLPAEVSIRERVLEPISDAREYHALAERLVEHDAFEREIAGRMQPEMFRTPLYPLVLAGIRFVFGDCLGAILGLQLLLSLLILLATRALARDSGLSERGAGLAALLVAMSPNLAFHATKAVTETLFTLLLAVCMLMMARYRRTDSAPAAPATSFRESIPLLVGIGTTAGLLALTRPIAVFWPLVIVGWVGLRCRRRRVRTAWLALVPLVAALLTMAPWIARNHRVSGRAIISTAAERNVFLYNAATVVAAEKNLTVAQARDLMQLEARERFGELDSADEAGYWARLGAVGRDELLRRPLRTTVIQLAGFAANFVVPVGVSPLLVHVGVPRSEETHVMQRALALAARGRVAQAWGVVRESRLGLAGTFFWVWFGLSALHVALLLALAAAGLRTPTGRRLGWLLLPVFYFTILTGPVGEARFRVPVEPALAVLAAVALVRVRATFPLRAGPSPPRRP